MNSVFTAAGIQTRVVYRFDYTDPNIEWADAIVTTGGDGTFLLAASRILDRNKPLIGFNSDPTRSKGQLCLPQKYSVEVQEAVDKLLKVNIMMTIAIYYSILLFNLILNDRNCDEPFIILSYIFSRLANYCLLYPTDMSHHAM